MKKLLSSVCISLLLGAFTASKNANAIVDSNTNSIPGANSKPKNIIMVVADGMGPAYTTAYRYYNDNPDTPAIEKTVFDRHLVGMASTYPARVSGYVTDSAAAATALATGVKSYNGAIGVDIDKTPVESVLFWAKKQGKKTGVVVTSQINHATPAAYLTHNESRNNYNAIADSYLDGGINADLYLGGGWQYFLRQERNLVNEFKTAGFHYLDNFQALQQLPVQKPVLGLFSDIGLPWALDDTNKFRLSVMTEAATKQLENAKGYFLLVEASQIDWAGHANDIAAAMAEMADLAKTMQYLEQYVKKNPDTLVVLTADHSTGGLTIAAQGKYEWQPKVIKSMLHSPQKIAAILSTTQMTVATVSKLLNFTISAAELKALQEAKVHGAKLASNYQKLDKKAQQQYPIVPSVKNNLYLAIKVIIDQRTNSGWTTGGHTAVDVPVFALGSNKEMFAGQIDNTDIAKQIFSLLDKK